MGIFVDNGSKEQSVGLTPHGREALESDAVELNRSESDVMWYLKENSAKGLKDISRSTGLPFATTRYVVNDLMKKRLVEWVG